MRGPGFFAFAERKHKCLMILNYTKFNSAPRRVRQIRRKSLYAPFLKNVRDAPTPRTDLFAGAEMEAVFALKLKD